MTDPRDLNDPRRPTSDESARIAGRMDNRLQADPELAEGGVSGGRIAMFAIVVAVILGAVFYGLNNAPSDSASSSMTPPAQTTAAPQSTPKGDRSVAEESKPPVAPGVRDVTPYNTAPGTTTGNAPQQPAPQQAPPAGTQQQ